MNRSGYYSVWGAEEARLLLENGEYALYRRIQRKMVKMVREYYVQLPLNCLQFVYCRNRLELIKISHNPAIHRTDKARCYCRCIQVTSVTFG